MSETARPQPGAVPFDEAIRFLRAKTNVPTDGWRDLSAAEYARSFAVAGVRDMQALEEIRAAVDRALADGTTLDAFRADLRDIMARTGLTLRGRFGWRSRTILETNLRTAYAAGRWEQIQRLKDARPYLRYEAVLDNRTRPQHRAWHGTVLPVDHEFWRTHYPPNGWGCRCTVRSLSERDLRRYGYTVTDPPPPSGSLPRSIRTPDGNRIVELPPGIDEGWDHNVGILAERWRGLIPEPPEAGPLVDAAEAAGSATASAIAQAAVRAALPPMPPPRALPASLILPAGMPDEAYVRAFLSAFGATMERPAPFRDVTGETLLIGAPLFTTQQGELKVGKRDRAPYVLLLAEAVRAPDEVWDIIEPARIARPDRPRFLFRRRFVARFSVAEMIEPAFVVFEWSRAVWSGVTAFRPSEAEYIDAQRRGRLVYRREDR
ncbi:MAG: minor capsid protein [Rhodobacter sp.]|nr:minor capsid protein [Rhodobacter sp.]